MTIREAFDLYCRDVIQFGNQSRKTEEHHNVALKSLLTFLGGDIPIEELTFDKVRQWKNDMEMRNRSAGTIYGYIVRLRCVLAYMQRKGVQCLDVNDVPPPKRKKRAPGFLTEEEVAMLVVTAKQTRGQFRAKRNAAIVALLYSSGIRVSELVRMNITDVHYDTFSVFGKSDDPRPCFIDARARQHIDEYLELRTDNNDALFISEIYRERMTVGNVQEVFRGLKKRSGLKKKVTPHIERHSFATNFLRNNGNMRYLQEMLGHESLETTQVYAQVVNEDLRAVHAKHHTI